MKAPLLLVGAQRSGTTALAHLLSAAYAEQGGLFTVNGKLWYVLRRWLTPDDLRGRHLRADEMVHALQRRPAQGAGAQLWLADTEHALRWAARAVGEGRYPATTQGARALALDVEARVYGRKPWGDKYNEYLLDLPFLYELFPAARWIMLFRHPAEVATSMLAWTGDRPWNPATVADAEAKWTAWNRCWLDFRDRLHCGQAIEIDYGDLCTGDALARLTEFTGFDLSTYIGAFVRSSPPRAWAGIGPAAASTWARLGTRGNQADANGEPATTTTGKEGENAESAH